MADIEITTDALTGLAAKLEGLDLNAEEAAVVDAVLERAASAEAEVEGFYMYGTTALKDLAGEKGYMLGMTYTLKLAKALGVRPDSGRS